MTDAKVCMMMDAPRWTTVARSCTRRARVEVRGFARHADATEKSWEPCCLFHLPAFEAAGFAVRELDPEPGRDA